MGQVTVEDIQRNFPAYLRRVEAGEKLVITRGGKPIAEVTPTHMIAATVRPFGLCKGEFTVPDDFDAPLPENVLDSFEGK
jgi:prevent-host-death family protein